MSYDPFVGIIISDSPYIVHRRKDDEYDTDAEDKENGKSAVSVKGHRARARRRIETIADELARQNEEDARRTRDAMQMQMEQHKDSLRMQEAYISLTERMQRQMDDMDARHERKSEMCAKEAESNAQIAAANARMMELLTETINNKASTSK